MNVYVLEYLIYSNVFCSACNDPHATTDPICGRNAELINQAVSDGDRSYVPLPSLEPCTAF